MTVTCPTREFGCFKKPPYSGRTQWTRPGFGTHVCCSRRTDQAGKKPGHDPVRGGEAPGLPRRREDTGAERARPGVAQVCRNGSRAEWWCHFPAAERAGLPTAGSGGHCRARPSRVPTPNPRETQNAQGSHVPKSCRWATGSGQIRIPYHVVFQVLPIF